MAKILSQDAVDQLLPNIASGEASGPSMETPKAKRKIIVYDFKRPDKFSKDQIRTVAIMHEAFARSVTTGLSAELRSLAHAHLASVDQLTYEEFICSIPNPTTIAIIDMDPLRGSAVLEMDPAVTFAIIDRLFGGQGDGLRFSREITAIESSVIGGLVIRMLGYLAEAWQNVIDLRPRLVRMERNPQFASIVPPNEMIMLVTLETKVGSATGMINLAFPYLTIEPIIPKLCAQYYYSEFRKTGKGVGRATTMGLDISAEVYFEGVRLTLCDLGRLKKGSLVKIPDYGRQRAFLRLGGGSLFELEARPGGRRKPPVYAVVSKTSEEYLPFLESAEKKGEPSAMETMEAAMREELRRLGNEIGESLAGMKSAIGTLRQKQEEMADQLAFGPQELEAGDVKRSAEHAMLFDFVRRADPARLLSLIRQEHPQLIALILSYLEPQKASGILGSLPAESQPDVARRIACMNRTSPEVLHEVERVLEMQLSFLSSKDYVPAGGVEGLVEILGMADRSTEKHVVESLEKSDPELTEEIKRRMFVFEDIVLLDRKAIDAVVRKIEADILLRALKAAPENVRGLIWESLPPADGEKLKLRLKELGPVRLHDVERAQQKIVATIREMEEAGEIFIGLPGEEPKIVE
jgi:flagellar motor switch protein FliM